MPGTFEEFTKQCPQCSTRFDDENGGHGFAVSLKTHSLYRELCQEALGILDLVFP
jgi:hypothetical protein